MRSSLSETKITTTQISACCLILWIAMQGWLFISRGPQLSVDSDFYIQNAQVIQSGHLPQARGFWYTSYAGFLALVFLLGGGITTVVIIQMMLSGVAAISLYFATYKLVNSKAAAFMATLLFILWFKIHEWNTFIYTESLFTSCLVISFGFLLSSGKWWHYGLCLLFLVVVFFIRPVGIAMLVGILFYGFALVWPKLNRVVATLALLLITCLGLLMVNAMLTDFNFIASYQKGELIYPNISLGISVPVDLTIPSMEYPPLVQLVLFACLNPIYFFKLSVIKLLLFFGNVKPYFSPLHNVLIVCTLYPIYFFALRGVKVLSEATGAKSYIFGYVLASAFMVALTSENWDGRFLVPLLPFVFLLAAAGMARERKLDERIFTNA
jgi:hypothetical protein